MNPKILCSSIALCLIATGFAADNSPSATPSKQEDRKIERVAGEEVGCSAVDGITVSGTKAFVTRNGKTEKLLSELTLDDGTKVFPDGTIRTEAGKVITLKQEQVLRFNGKIAVAPTEPVDAPAATVSTAGVFPGNVSGVTGTTSSGTVGVGAVSSSGVVGTAGTTGVVGVGGGFGPRYSNFPYVVAPGTTASGNALIASEVTTDPRTGLPVYSAVNPATGQRVTTTTDPRTNQSISTTTINGQQISTTTNPQTGLPVTITTNAQGQSTATTVDPTSGQSVPIQYNSQTGQFSTPTGTTNTPTQSNLLQQNPAPTTQQGFNQQPLSPQSNSQLQPGTTSGTQPTTTSGTGTRTGTSGTQSGTTRGGTGATSGGVSGGKSGATSGGTSGGGNR